MENVRVYGRAPFDVAVVHGGPGAPGEMAPVARELAAACPGLQPGPAAAARGVLEPLQTASTVPGQVAELAAVLRKHGHPPVVLIGHSWGAMLCFILTAECPSLVRKLVLVSSGVFDESYAAGIEGTRLGRLSVEEAAAVDALTRSLDDPNAADRNRTFARLGGYISRADAFDPLPDEGEVMECQYDLHRRVWGEARRLRSSGGLLALGRRIGCPVVAIHGDYDPHPAEGVKVPLSGVLTDFRFILLEKCGHRPWLERAARDRFYGIIREQLS